MPYDPGPDFEQPRPVDRAEPAGTRPEIQDGQGIEGARGIARRIDHLGRVVIPSEYRKVFGIENGDLLDMTIEGDGVVVRRLERSCVFCRSLDDLGMFRGKLLCDNCLTALRSDATPS